MPVWIIKSEQGSSKQWFYDAARDDWFNKPYPGCLFVSEKVANSVLGEAKQTCANAKVIKYSVKPA